MHIYKNIPMALLIFCLAIAGRAQALSFTGVFTADDDVFTTAFTVTTFSEVTLRTVSYAGGMLSDGTLVPSGGFDPILSLFDGMGFFVADNDDGEDAPGSCAVPADSTTGLEYDACLVALLSPDTYTIALTQFDNFSVGPTLADGFEMVGDPFFTANFGCSNEQFCDFEGNDREPFFVFEVIVTPISQPVPEPGTLLLLGTGFLGLLGYGWRRHQGLSAKVS